MRRQRSKPVEERPGLGRPPSSRLPQGEPCRQPGVITGRSAGFREVAAVILALSVLGTYGQGYGAAEPQANPGPGIQVFETPESSPALAAADQRLAQAIQARLQADPWVLSFEVAVTVRGGVATLHGTVGTLLAKERAAQVAAAVPGVQQVNNQVVVSLPPRYDWAIQAEVEAYFAHSAALRSSPPLVRVEKGFVILSGAVHSAYEKQLAAWVAASVPGVGGVENELRVDWLAHRSDKAMQRDVESRLQWDPWLVNPLIRVQVRQGTVHLAGMVGAADARQRAVQDARVEGVRAVDASALAVHQTGAAGASDRPAADTAD